MIKWWALFILTLFIIQILRSFRPLKKKYYETVHELKEKLPTFENQRKLQVIKFGAIWGGGLIIMMFLAMSLMVWNWFFPDLQIPNILTEFFYPFPITFILFWFYLFFQKQKRTKNP